EYSGLQKHADFVVPVTLPYQPARYADAVLRNRFVYLAHAPYNPVGSARTRMKALFLYRSILRHTPETALLHHATHPWPDMNGATADPANYGLSEIVKTGSNYFFSKSPVATIRIANHFRPANATLAVICRIDRASQSIP